KQTSQVGTSTLLQGGSTTQSYDVNGNLIAVTDSAQGANSRVFVNDAAGHALYVNQQGHIQRELIVNGEMLGRYGDLVDGKNPSTAAGLPNYINSADFNFSYQPISGNYPSASAGVYAVGAGDTLSSIAKGAYGDSSLWYLIADANGLNGDAGLKVGQTLTIPARVNTANNAGTFAPYDPSKVVGDTTPNLPSPPGSSNGCGALGKIIMAVVAVVATIYTAGALSGVTGGFLETMSAGMGVMTGGAAGGALGAAGSFGAAGSALGVAGTMAVASAAGSIASQLVGNALGTQQGFSWRSVALSAIGGGVSAGLAGNFMGTTAGSLSNVVARAAVGNALSQGIGVVTGLQPSFDWTSVAASAVGAGVGYGMSEGLGLTSNGISTNAFSGFDKFSRVVFSGVVATTASAVAGGGRVSIQQIAVDAFGNALGGSLVDAMQSPINTPQQNFRGSEIAYQNANAPAGLGLGSGYVPSGNSYQSGDLGSGSFGIDLPVSDQVRAMAAEAEGGRILTQMRDASIDAEQTAQLAQARQARMTRAAATTAANVGMSQEEAGAIYMAYGGRAARNAGSSAVNGSISEAPGLLSNLGSIGRAYLNDQIGFGDAVSMANDQIGGYGNVARDTLTGLANGGIRTFGTAISLIGPSPGESPFPEFGYTGRTGELGPDIALATTLGLGARGVRNAAAAEAATAEVGALNPIEMRQLANAELRASSTFAEDMASVGVTPRQIELMSTGKLPLGFKNEQQFALFKSELDMSLRNAGLADAEVGLKGTSTTFYSENPSKDLGHHWDKNPAALGDYDLNVTSPTMVNKLQGAGITASEKYGVFKTADMQRSFGPLDEFRQAWSKILGRDVNFVGYPAAQARDTTEYILRTTK
ncbi:MAG: LysM domain-containing protein, partial [Rhodoferax sp.]|uniref:LysM peptidoglycan-binding domain-containing protein n=1 Tax=Rhodoferax sp. TaxID=50421 RepID=UPI002631AC88